MGTAVGAWAFKENAKSSSAEQSSGFTEDLPKD
jgi:hypothetical protein